MSETMYLVIMVGIIGVFVVVSLPSLLRKRCQNCGVRNSLDAPTCRNCGAAFPEEG